MLYSLTKSLNSPVNTLIFGIFFDKLNENSIAFFPVGKKAIEFSLRLSKNIPNIKIFTGEFKDLVKEYNNKIFYKQHPLNYNYHGIEDSRDWLTSIKGCYPSFFSFWKKAKKELKF